MAAAVPLFSSKVRRRAVSITATILVSGCAASAPPLPPDTTSVNAVRRSALADFDAADAALICADIDAERAKIAEGLERANANIAANRQKNEVAGYLGGLFLVPLAATEGNYGDKDQITRLYARQDVLVRLAVVKKCPEPSEPGRPDRNVIAAPR